jgi:formate dehydrogenase subunit gamma
MGADALMIHAREKLGCTAQSHSADGVFTVEPVFCLGLCASAPALTVDERLHARVTPEAFDLLVSQLEVQS